MSPDPFDLAAKYLNGYGGREDENGNILIPPANTSGLWWDRDLMKEPGLKDGNYKQRTCKLTNPTIYKGSTPNEYNYRSDNCASFARQSWFVYSGERFFGGILWDNVELVVDAIMELNNPVLDDGNGILKGLN
jgi:hypothetical protein